MTTDMSIFFFYIPALEHLLSCLPVGRAGRGAFRRGQAGTLGLSNGEDGNERLSDENDHCYTSNSVLQVDESPVLGGSTIHALAREIRYNQSVYR